MNAKQLQPIGKNSNKVGKGSWLLGGTLVVAAALAISFAIRSAPPKPAVEPPSRPQTVPDASAQGVLGYIQAHEGNGANSVQIVPDANSRAVLAYLNAHKVAPADRPQTGPAANTQSVLGYLNAHSVAPAAVSQTYFTQLFQAQPQPDAIAQSYFLQLYPTQRVPDAATKGVLDYLRAHGANLQ